jgi:phosphoenolpyruvate-protein phosphotransferase (PTS system enzyme I)
MEGTTTEHQEIILKGIAASAGIATGTAYLYSKQIPLVSIKTLAPEDVDAEVERLRAANARSERELQKILSFAEQKLGAQSARIFEAQIMILNDTILMGEIERRIREELRNVEYLVLDEIGKYKRLMLAAPDEYMHERAHDVDDVMNRIIRNIQDQKLFSRLEGESIIVSESLAPADTVIFSRNQILGYATDFGGTTSHAALLSRSLKIPAVVGLRSATRRVHTGDTIAIDGYGGMLFVHPTEETLQGLRRKQQRFRDFEQHLVAISGLAAETVDHRQIELSANIEFIDEAGFAREQGAAGIGLYRTESLLMGRGTFPCEEEQFSEYDAVAAAMHPHPVIFRTFDIGGDKLIPDTPREDNPFLGWRGIRVLLDRPAAFLPHLRALLRASARRNVRIMFPMVSGVSEVRAARTCVEEAKRALEADGLAFDQNLQIGVMIEVPSAALQAEEIAKEVDFLSIGTNDLIQYLLAVDRGNSSVAALYQPFHPAVLRTIRSIITAGHKHNRWVGMCGEMAGDPLATIPLVGMGLDEFSVIPSILPEIKKIIRSVRYRDAKRTAERILGLSTEGEIRAILAEAVHLTLPDLPLDE